MAKQSVWKRFKIDLNKDSPATILKKWTGALESGEIEQGESQLEYNNRFCCLGVINKLCGELVKGNRGFISNLADFEFGTYGLLVNKQLLFSDLNDTKRFTFKQIAAYIKSHKNIITKASVERARRVFRT